MTGRGDARPYGLLKNGIENVKPILTRGIYIDLAAFKGVATLPEHYEITRRRCARRAREAGNERE